jgi:endonuclease/exonuclease/phosphatase family metal-dependent hydrolase
MPAVPVIPPRPSDTIRVATINLWEHEPTIPERYDTLIAWLTALQPDILGVQEIIPWHTHGHLNQITRDTGLTTLHPPAAHSDVAILTSDRITVTRTEPIRLSDTPEHLVSAATIDYLTPNQRPQTFITTHLAWGPHHENTRWKDLRHLDQWATSKTGHIADHHTPRVILTGDFNAQPAQQSQRWLRGEDIAPNHTSTMWIDTWTTAPHQHPTSTPGNPGNPDGPTSTPNNPWAIRTGQDHNFLNPAALPHRRIDYIYIRGYSYATAAAPHTAGIWGDHPAISDHYGIWADLTDPPQPVP